MDALHKSCVVPTDLTRLTGGYDELRDRLDP